MGGAFDGAVYDPTEDDARLTDQIGRIRTAMSDERWRTLMEIAAVTGDPPASISAQLRHLRKPKHGSYVVEKRPRGLREHGLFEYRVLPPGSASSYAPTPRKVKTKTGFLAGLMFAARLVLKAKDMEEAKTQLRAELVKAARK